jgi:hypothetical protein
MAIICDGYPEAQVSKENFINNKRALGGLVDDLPQEGFTSRLFDTCWAKELSLWYAKARRLVIGW